MAPPAAAPLRSLGSSRGRPIVSQARTSGSSASKALQFDGTAYVSIPGDRFRNLQSGALSVWIRPTAGGGVILTSLHDTSNDRQFFSRRGGRG